jgi:hypothetical protein
MFPTIPSLSHTLTFEQLIDRLKSSPHVEGLALFGSPPGDNPASDYDLLVVLANPPVQMFQMSTAIDGRGADIAFSESEVVERVLNLDQAVSATSLEAFSSAGWNMRASSLIRTTSLRVSGKKFDPATGVYRRRKRRFTLTGSG